MTINGDECIQPGNTGEKDGVSHYLPQEGKNVLFHLIMQNGTEFKSCELFTSGIFHLMSLYHG